MSNETEIKTESREGINFDAAPDFIIHDKFKKQYRVVPAKANTNNFKRFDILSGHAQIGYVNYYFASSEVLLIDDLHIRHDAILFPLLWWDLIVVKIYLPSVKWKTHNFQGRGIGTAMLEFMAGYARSRSAKRIEGHLSPHDLRNNPDLANWYRSRGFTVEGNKISLSL